MAWTTPRTWVAGEDLTAALQNTHVRDNFDETAPAIATVTGRLIVTDGANSITERDPTSDYEGASQTTTSTTYTDLATVGPAVTVTAGGSALVMWSAELENDTAGGASFVGVAVSGATTSAAADDHAMFYRTTTAGYIIGMSYVYLQGLTAGSNTFTLKYRVSAGTGTFRLRRLAVIPF